MLLIWCLAALVVAIIGSGRKIGFWVALFVSLLFVPLGMFVVWQSPRNNQAPAPPPVPPLTARLRELERLRDANAITEEEYQAARRAALNSNQ